MIIKSKNHTVTNFTSFIIRSFSFILLLFIFACAYNHIGVSAASKPGKPTIAVVPNYTYEDKMILKVVVDKNDNTDGYSVYIKTPGKSKFKAVLTQKYNGDYSRTLYIYDLAPGKYQVKVKAYKEKGSKKVWGKFSDTQKVTLKKVKTSYPIDINEKNFPDDIFRQIILDTYDQNKDSKLSKEEADSCVVLNLRLSGVSNLKGIEYFKQLSSLSCDENNLTELDLSGNFNIDSIFCEHNQIQSINISNCYSLKRLTCDNNQITSLDLSNNTLLEEVSARINNISTLKFGKKPYLKRIDFHTNKLTSIKVNSYTSLEKIVLSGNDISKIDVSNLKNLISLDISGNSLKKLNVKNNTKLKELLVSGNLFNEIDISRNTELTRLAVQKLGLKKLDVSKNTKLVEFWCGYNELTELDVSNNSNLYGLYCNDNQLKTIELNNHPELKVLYCYHNNIWELDLRNVHLLSGGGLKADLETMVIK